ncbi:hypothetical protein Poly21_44280 [Allorhodopirellula heiligendammensis]|uniref:Uncharacterized protein n=1 Tax=Allorhodopirellula heiligendammensis TaxID=2714739 RepID=A0A5C6BEG9_9BACT|nr:hypothetical protein Poly21_44280 [Allorhodopirellula heiligendammensis]
MTGVSHRPEAEQSRHACSKTHRFQLLLKTKVDSLERHYRTDSKHDEILWLPAKLIERLVVNQTFVMEVGSIEEGSRAQHVLVVSKYNHAQRLYAVRKRR